MSELFWSDEDKEKAMEERDQERKKKSQQKKKSTNPSAKKRKQSDEKPAASKRSRANRASRRSESMNSMEVETKDATNLDVVDVKMQPEPVTTAQPLESMEVDLLPGAMEMDLMEEESKDATNLDVIDDEPEVQMQPEPVTTAQPLERMEVDLIPGTMETDSMEVETKDANSSLCGITIDANTVDETADGNESQTSDEQSLESLLPSLPLEAIPEEDAENETNSIHFHDAIDETKSNHHVKQKKTKKRMLKELESSLDGIYWKGVIGTGRMVTRSQSRKVALA